MLSWLPASPSLFSSSSSSSRFVLCVSFSLPCLSPQLMTFSFPGEESAVLGDLWPVLPGRGLGAATPGAPVLVLHAGSTHLQRAGKGDSHRLQSFSEGGKATLSHGTVTALTFALLLLLLLLVLFCSCSCFRWSNPLHSQSLSGDIIRVLKH